MSWFTEVATDGLLGGVIGGLVTGVAVWWTLRAQTRGAELEAAVVAIVRLQSACGGLVLLASGSKTTPAEAQRRYHLVLEAAMEARARLFLRWPDAAASLADALDRLGQVTDGPERLVLAGITTESTEIVRLCRDWLEARHS